MDIFLEKVNYEIARATQYLESDDRKPAEVYRVQIESLQDSVSLIHIAAATKKSPHDFTKVLVAARWALESLKLRVDQAESPSGGPTYSYYCCYFCTAKHCSDDCPAYPTLPQRKKILQQLSVCWKCLKPEHAGMPCVKLVNCENCNENSHPRVLCPQKCKPVDGASESLSDALSLGDLDLNSSQSSAGDFRPTTPLTTCTVVQSFGRGTKTSVRLVIASGSSSMISESVVDRLGIKSRYEKAIAHLDEAQKKRANVRIKVLVEVPNGPPVPLILRIVKNVCDKTVVTPTVEEFKKEHRHLANMHFPDTGSGLPIEMLIGGESELASVGFNCGLNGEECPLVNRERGWSLVSSKFGWIIVGTDTSDEPVMFSLKHNTCLF